MTREEAEKTISKMLSVTDLTVRANMTSKMVEACHIAKNALKTLSAIDSIINREDSLIGRAQEDVIRYQMICKVMQAWKEGDQE